MRNIHLLPTTKPSRLYEFGGHFVYTKEPSSAFRNMNIYITNEEKIENGDYAYCQTSNSIIKWSIPNSAGDNRFKIILTTDDDLIKDNVQSIDDEFLEWFVNNPTCERAEVKDIGPKNLQKGFVYKIYTPVKIPKTNLSKLHFPELIEELVKYYEKVPLLKEINLEDLEEAATQYTKNESDSTLKLLSKYSFKDGAKWQRDLEMRRSNDKEEWINLFDICSKEEILEYLIDYKFPL